MLRCLVCPLFCNNKYLGVLNNFKYFKFKMEPFTIAEPGDSDYEAEVNLIHRHQENPPNLIVRRASRNSNNGKKKSRENLLRGHRFFLNLLTGFCVFLLCLALIGISIGLYSVIAQKFQNEDFEKLLNEQTRSQNTMEKELETLKKEVLSQQTLIKRLETALAKKEKQYNEANQKLEKVEKTVEEIYDQVRFFWLWLISLLFSVKLIGFHVCM